MAGTLTTTTKRKKKRLNPVLESDISYLSSRLGITKLNVKIFLKVLAEYISTKLGKCEEVVVYKLGTLNRIGGNKRTHIRFKASSNLYAGINKPSLDSYSEVLKDLREQLNSEDDVIDPKTVEDTLAGLNWESRQPRHIKMRVKSQLIRMSLLKYLQRDLIYQEDWVHPITKNEYSYERILYALKLIRVSFPSSYESLYCFWLCIDERTDFINGLKKSPEAIWYNVYKCLDLILFVVMNPELDPDDFSLLFKLEEGVSPESQ